MRACAMGLATWLLRAVYGVGGVAGLGLALLYFFQEKLLYVPRIPGLPSGIWKYPNEFGLEFEDVQVTAEDGVELHAWLLWGHNMTPERRRSRPVVVFFQENAGNMSFRLPFLRLLAYRLDAVVFAPSYRGYGLSKGKPSQQGIQKDARAFLQHLLGRPDVDAERIVLMGRSLGGAVAIHLAAEQQDKVAALVVENTFTSVEDMVSRVVPPLGLLIGAGRPCNFLVTNKWTNLAELPKVTKLPLLMFISMRDEMVPCWQMHKLQAVQRAPACDVVEFAEAFHMDAYDSSPEQYWGSLRRFVDKYVGQAAAEHAGSVPYAAPAQQCMNGKA